MRKGLLLIAIAVAAAVAASLAGQTADRVAPLTERIDVSVISVDAFVTDRHGNPVEGLTRDDFEVFEDGRLQPISNFYSIANAGLKPSSTVSAADPASPAAAQHFRRKVVLLVDNNFIDKPPRDAALRLLDKFIDDHFAGGYDWSVATIGADVRTLLPFTDDKARIHEALKLARKTPTLNSQVGLEREILSDPGHRGLREGVDRNGDLFGETMRFKGREQTMRNLMATRNSALALVEMCRAYSAEEGKKLVVLVTGGMERNTSFSAYDNDKDRNMRDMKLETEQILDAMTREANAANFNIYVINAKTRGMQALQHDVSNKSAGLTSNGSALYETTGSEPVDVSDVDSASLKLALGTGGLYMPGLIDRSYEKIDRETANFYSLGYRSPHPEDGQYHHIKVVVKKPGLYIRHRDGYVDASVDQKIEQTLRAPMSFPKERGALRVTLEVGRPDPGAQTLSVPVTVALPMSSLTVIPRDNQFVGRVHVYLSVYDSTGRNVGYHHQIQNVSLTRQEFALLADTNFRYKMNVGLKRGEYTVAITLRDDITNEIGTATKGIRLF
jgi:VWFA-related protein